MHGFIDLKVIVFRQIGNQSFQLRVIKDFLRNLVYKTRIDFGLDFHKIYIINNILIRVWPGFIFIVPQEANHQNFMGTVHPNSSRCHS